MLFQRVNRTDPEKVFAVFLNNNSGSTAAGDTAQLELAAASIDGVKARSVASGNEFAFLGVWDGVTTTGSYGLVQVYGYRSSAKVFQTNTSIDTGAVLVAVAGQLYMQSIVTTVASNTTITQQPIMAVLGQSIASSAASATVGVKVFIRAM